MGFGQSSQKQLQRHIIELQVLAHQQKELAAEAEEREKETSAEADEAVNANLHVVAGHKVRAMMMHRRRSEYCLDMIARIDEIIDVLQQQKVNTVMSASMNNITALLERITAANGDASETMRNLQNVLDVLKADESKIAQTFAQRSNRGEREKEEKEYLAFLQDRAAQTASVDVVVADREFEKYLDESGDEA